MSPDILMRKMCPFPNIIFEDIVLFQDIFENDPETNTPDLEPTDENNDG